MAALDTAFQSNSSGIPPPALNGGLYTGEPFKKGAPWANVPVVPDASYMIHYNLRSANPPPGAIYQYPGYNRPGNNTIDMIGVRPSKQQYNMSFIQDRENPSLCNCHKCLMSKYAYV